MTTTTDDPRRQHMLALLAEIPPDERLAFESYYQERQRAALSAAHAAAAGSVLGAADPYAVEAELLETLIRETDGLVDGEGLGLVPTAEQECWIEVPDRDPRVAGTGAKPGQRGADGAPIERKNILVAVVIALVGLGGLIWTFWPQIRPKAAPAAVVGTAGALTTTVTPVESVDIGANVQVWYPSSLELPRDGGDLVLRVAAAPGALGGSWAPELTSGVAAWLEGTYVNSIFCVPPDLVAVMGELPEGQPILMRPANGAVRTYIVARVRQVARQQIEVLSQRRAGLTVIVCGIEGATRTVVEAVYQPDPLPGGTGQIGSAQTLDQFARVTVQAATVVTTTELLSPGMAALAVRSQIVNLSSAPLALADLADQLRIDDQTAVRLAAPTQATIAPGASLVVTHTYQIGAAGGTAIWQLLSLAGEQIGVRWTVPALPQPAVFQSRLDPADLRLVQRAGQPALIIPVQIQAVGSVPARLEMAAVEVTSNARPLTLEADSTALPLTLAPGATQRLLLVVPLPLERTLVVRVASQHWQITLPTLVR